MITKHSQSSDYIKKKITTAEQVIKLLTQLKELSHPSFIDYQLAQLISDAAHATSVDLGNRVVFSHPPGDGGKASAETGAEREAVVEEHSGPVHYDGGPNQFSQPGCEIACTIISLIFALLYLQNGDVPFREFIKTIDWSVLMGQSKHIFKSWRRISEEKLRAGKISSLPPYPTMDEVWLMPNLKSAVSSYVTVDKSGYYKTEHVEDDGLASFDFVPFKRRLQRLDAETRQRKSSLVNVVTSISLTICIIAMYNPTTASVRYVIYDPHGTFILRRETAHYAINFRNDDADKKGFLGRVPFTRLPHREHGHDTFLCSPRSEDGNHQIHHCHYYQRGI